MHNWHQSAKLVQCPRVWDTLKREHPEATVFVNGWWNGMHDVRCWRRALSIECRADEGWGRVCTTVCFCVERERGWGGG